MPSDSTRIRVFYQLVWHLNAPAHLQARNVVSETNGIRDALPTHMALPTDIAPPHYQPIFPMALSTRLSTGITDIIAGITTQSANRASLITVACDNLHYGLADAPRALPTRITDIAHCITNPYYHGITGIAPSATGKKPRNVASETGGIRVFTSFPACCASRSEENGLRIKL